MADDEDIERLGGLLAEAAHAHHEATDGGKPDWAAWYADYLRGKIDRHVGFSPDSDTVESWLTMADERHLSEEPETKYWPALYARYILEDYTREHEQT